MRELYQLLHRAAYKAPSGASAEQVADALGISRVSLAQQVNDDYPLRHFHIENLPAFVRVTGDDAPLDFLCEKSGGVFLRMPQVEASRAPVHVACMDAVSRFGDLMTSCSQALADGRISKEESDRLADAGYRAVHEIMRLLKTADKDAR